MVTKTKVLLVLLMLLCAVILSGCRPTLNDIEEPQVPKVQNKHYGVEYVMSFSGGCYLYKTEDKTNGVTCYTYCSDISCVYVGGADGEK